MRTGRVPLSVPAALAALALAATAAACSGGGTAADPDFTAAPGFDPDCIAVEMAVSPEKLTLLTDLAETFNGSGAKVGDRCVSVRVTRKSSGAAATLAPAGLAEPGEQRTTAGHLVPGGQRVGRHRQREGRAHAGAGRPALHADAARHRHAGPDGRGARLPGDAHRLRRHRRPRQRPGGLGQVRPPRVGPVQAGQDQSELLDQRAQLHGGRVLRGHGQDERPDRGGPGPARGGRLRPERGERGRPLRRHHPHVPQQLVPGRCPGHGVDVHLGRRRRGEVDHRLQLRQPRRRAVTGRDPAPAQGPPRRHLPAGGHALLGQPVPGAGRRMGDARAEARWPRCSRSSCSSPRTRPGSWSSASGPGTPR